MGDLYSLKLMHRHDPNSTRYVRINNFLHNLETRYELNTKLSSCG
jgi:hypothetical protein